MSDSQEHSKSRLVRRFWHGGFGAFIGALLGLILAGSLHANLLDGVLYGALAGLLIGLLFGPAGIEFVTYWWTG